MSNWPHQEVPNMFAGDGPIYTCKCGECFDNPGALQNHLWQNREIGDGVVKCIECGLPVYMPGKLDCSQTHFDSTSPEGVNCFPNNDIFKELPQFDGPINIPSVFMPVQPSMLEVLKALRDCFKATNGRVPTAPLDELIAKYDFTVSMETTVVDGEQLEANRYEPIDKTGDVPPSNLEIPMPPGVKPPTNEFGGTGGMDPDDEPHEQTGFGD